MPDEETIKALLVIPSLAIIIFLGYVIYSFKMGEHWLKTGYDLDSQYKQFIRSGLMFGLPKILTLYFMILMKDLWASLAFYVPISPWDSKTVIGWGTIIAIFLCAFPFLMILGGKREWIGRQRGRLQLRVRRRRKLTSYVVLYLFFLFFCYHFAHISAFGYQEGLDFIIVSLSVIILESAFLAPSTRNLLVLSYYHPVVQQGNEATQTPNLMEVVVGFLVMRYKSGEFLTLQLEHEEKVKAAIQKDGAKYLTIKNLSEEVEKDNIEMFNPVQGAYRFIQLPDGLSDKQVNVEIIDLNVFDEQIQDERFRKQKEDEKNVREQRKKNEQSIAPR